MLTQAQVSALAGTKAYECNLSVHIAISSAGPDIRVGMRFFFLLSWSSIWHGMLRFYFMYLLLVLALIGRWVQ